MLALPWKKRQTFKNVGFVFARQKWMLNIHVTERVREEERERGEERKRERGRERGREVER